MRPSWAGKAASNQSHLSLPVSSHCPAASLFVLHRLLSIMERRTLLSPPPLELAHPLASSPPCLCRISICALCWSVLPMNQLHSGAEGCSWVGPCGKGPVGLWFLCWAHFPLGTGETYPSLTSLCYLRMPELFILSPLCDKGSKLL